MLRTYLEEINYLPKIRAADDVITEADASSTQYIQPLRTLLTQYA